MTSSTWGDGYQPPNVSAAPVEHPKLRPGRIWYLVALVVFAGAAAWMIHSVSSFTGTVDSLQRVPLVAGGTVNLEHSGGYVIYLEGPYYGGPGSQNTNPSFTVHVTPASPGASVTRLADYQSTVTYSVGSHHGRAIFTMNVVRPGKFTISTSGASGTGNDLAIGGSVASAIVGILLPALPLLILAFVGGLLVFILRIVRKSAMRRAANRAAEAAEYS